MRTTTTLANGHVSTERPLGTTRPPRRNHRRIALGALLVGVTTLAAVALYSNVGSRRAVFAVARPVDAGQEIQEADISEVRVSADPGLRSVPATDRAHVVGRVAAVQLVPGSLLAPGQLSDGTGIPVGMAIVGAVLKPGQFPVGIRDGQRVLVVTAPPANATSSTADSPSTQSSLATVSRVEHTTDSGGTLSVSLIVPKEIAAGLAMAGADGRVRLVVTAP